MTDCGRRHGFVLLVVLWVMVGLSVLGLGLALGARRIVAAARNRRYATEAAWTAEGCLEEARATIGAVLDDGRDDSATRASIAWRNLDAAVAAARSLPLRGCDIALRSAGSRLDVNTADPDMLRCFFRAVPLPGEQADSLTDALLDWRDVDIIPRALGAERDWYTARERAPPHDGPLADVRELARVRGFDAIPALDTLLDVESGRIDLNHAPLAVVRALPGMSDEALARLEEVRARGVLLPDLDVFANQLSPSGRVALGGHYADLTRLATTDPDAWILTSRARAGDPPITAVIELRLVRAGTHAAVTRRRTWLQ